MAILMTPAERARWEEVVTLEPAAGADASWSVGTGAETGGEPGRWSLAIAERSAGSELAGARLSGGAEGEGTRRSPREGSISGQRSTPAPDLLTRAGPGLTEKNGPLERGPRRMDERRLALSYL